jgi:HAE1 family hydrophobic/amphiphilic exporter-1
MGDGTVVRRLVGVWLIGCATLAHAQGVGLGDAVGAALRGAPEMVDAKLAVVESGADVKEADGAFDLRLDANWNYSESFAPVYLASVSTTQVLRLRDFILDQSVTRRFSIGTEIGVEYLSFTESVIAGETTTTLSRETIALRLTQPLLRGRSPSANLAPLRAAGRRDDATRLLLKARAADMARAVEVAYWELAYAERELEIQERALDASRKHLEDTRKRVRAGRVAPADMLIVERAVAVAADELVAADGRRRAKALELSRLTGLDAAALHARDWPRDRGTVRPEAVMEAVRSAPMAHSIDALREAREQEARATDDRSLPRLDLVAMAGPSGEQPNVGDAFRAMARFDELAWSVGLVFTWSPAGSAQDAAAERAQAERRRAGLAREIARRDLEDRARKLVAALDGAVRRGELAQKAVDLARRALSAEQARFEAGAVPAKNLLDRQMELAQAELREARVQADAAVARAEIEGMTGENLDRFGVH